MNGLEKHKDKDDFQLLYRAIISINTTEEAELFLDDLLTVIEVENISQRLKIAMLLQKKKSYKEISESVGASSVTIGRVKRTFEYGDGGYKLIISRLLNQNIGGSD